MNKKYALTVGINNYPGTYNDLQGCVNDAVDWSALLHNEGYAVLSLLDGGATKAAILKALEDRVALANFGDRIVFTYSGHGTWIPDRDGDETDQRDEALCPHDFESNGLITDDELQNVFAKLKYGSTALVLSDSCHSGTVARLVGLDANLAKPRARFISPATFMDISPVTAEKMEARAGAKPRKSANLISGCSDTEYSYDASFNGRPNGAFTRAAIDAYSTGLSLGKWFTKIRETLPSTRYPQTPQLSATYYRKVTRAL